ncbi:MAG: dipeptide epimerase [Cyclobacteriaceae bacterium]
MRIKEVRTYSKDLGTKRPYTIAYKTVDEVINAFVEIELDNGMIGIGAANPSPKVVGESVDDTIKTLAGADFSYLKGRNIGEIESLLRDTQTKYGSKPGVNVALDVALHDAFAQFLGIPLCQYFGQKQQSLPTSVTIGIKNVAETVAEADEYHGMGFRVLKVKTGLNPEEDAERVVKIAEKRPDMVIRVDANQGYTVEDLNRFVKLSSKVNLEFIEQPFSVDAFASGVKQLDAEVLDLVVADESLKNTDDALCLVRDAPGCRIFNIKLMKTGGLKTASEIATIAKYSGVDLMWGCNDESIVSIAAALHLALSYSHTRFLDLDGSLDNIRDVVSGGFLIDNGIMSISGKPGLGVSIIQ